MVSSSAPSILARYHSPESRRMRPTQLPDPERRGPHPAEDVLTVHLEVERGAPFCADPRCALHVRLADSRVAGGGNWVTLPDGRVFGRGRYGWDLLCDACGTLRGPVRLPGRPRPLAPL